MWTVLALIVFVMIFILIFKVFQKVVAFGCMGLILLLLAIGSYLYLSNGSFS